MTQAEYPMAHCNHMTNDRRCGQAAGQANSGGGDSMCRFAVRHAFVGGYECVRPNTWPRFSPPQHLPDLCTHPTTGHTKLVWRCMSKLPDGRCLDMWCELAPDGNAPTICPHDHIQGRT